MVKIKEWMPFALLANKCLYLSYALQQHTTWRNQNPTLSANASKAFSFKTDFYIYCGIIQAINNVNDRKGENGLPLFFKFHSMQTSTSVTDNQSRKTKPPCSFMTAEIRKKRTASIFLPGNQKCQKEKIFKIRREIFWQSIIVKFLLCVHIYCEQIIFLIMQTSEEDDSLTWFPWLGAILDFVGTSIALHTKCQN